MEERHGRALVFLPISMGFQGFLIFNTINILDARTNFCQQNFLQNYFKNVIKEILNVLDRFYTCIYYSMRKK